MTETVGQAIPRSSVQDLFGVTEKERFEAELEFVQGLASPQYLNCESFSMSTGALFMALTTDPSCDLTHCWNKAL